MNNIVKICIAVILAVILCLTPVCTEALPGGGPEIVSIEVSDVSADGYTVTAQFLAPAGVRNVYMPTWTEHGWQDDLIWHCAEVHGNRAVFRVNTSQHLSEGGKYITHVYVYDRAGKYALAGTSAEVPGSVAAAPAIESINVSGTDADGYTVTAVFSAPAGVREVLMPTWTENNWQDDLIWHRAAVNGNQAVFHVSRLQHAGEYGKYITHVYVYDRLGRYALAGTAVQLQGVQCLPPAINDIQITDIDEQGYTVTAVFSADAGVREVLMPTWTERGGQDDLIWHKAQVQGNRAVFRVRVSDHKNEGGRYITHVYVYDKLGRYALAGTAADIAQQQTAGGPVVCIDAGHQIRGISEKEPNAPGSSVMKAKLTSGISGISTGLPEYKLNLSVALKLKQKLLSRGYQVVMIRETDECAMSNAERAVYANNSGADVFIRIHGNGVANTSVRGAVAYVPGMSNPYVPENSRRESTRLASAVLDRYCRTTGINNRGIAQSDTMTGINWCKIPVIILEMGFMSNPQEDQLMAQDSFQYVMAEGIASGLDAYFGR